MEGVSLMEKKNNTLAIIGVLSVVLIWGLSFLSIKFVIEFLGPMTLGFVRFVIASIVVLLIYKVKGNNEKVSKKDMPMMAIAGVIGVTLYFYFENNGVKYLPASTASLVIATIPIFTMIFERMIYKTKMTKLKVFGVMVSIVGVYFLVGGNLRELLTGDLAKGYGMMFAAVLAWTAYSLVTKPMFDKYSMLTIVFWQTIYGAVAFFPFIFFEDNRWDMIGTSEILHLLYLGVMCSAVAYYIYVYSMKELGVTTSSLFLNLMPLVTVVAGYFFLKETISLYQALGGALIVISVYISSWEPKKKWSPAKA